MEEWTNTLSQKRKMPFIITSKPKLATVGQIDDLLCHVGQHDKAVFSGDFSCCRLGHQADGRDIPCDKELLAPMVSKLYAAKLRHYF